MKKQSHKKGFTIIEVVLVLAIAGLIFLMVFVALPALQRNQRDTQRRDDYGMLASAVSSFAANNGGRLYKMAGGTCAGFDKSCVQTYTNENDLQKFINGTGQDPTRTNYKLTVYTVSKWASVFKAPEEHEVIVVLTTDCEEQIKNAAAPAKTNTNDNNRFAVYGYLESGTYCNEGTF